MNYLTPNHEVGDLSRWAQHLSAPSSLLFLADLNKPYITVEDLNFPDSLCAFDVPDREWNVHEAWLKGFYAPRFALTCVSNVCAQRLAERDCDAPDAAASLHRAFQGAAQLALGDELYTRDLLALFSRVRE